MKRLTAVVAIALLLLTGFSASAQTTNPDRDRLKIEPIQPKVPVEGEEGVEDEDVDPLTAIGGYFGNRFRDLADILTLKLGWGNYRSIGFQLRLTTLAQIGLGNFEGWVFAIDRGCVGVMKEAELEGGVSFLYPSVIARKVKWQTEEAKKKNIFFGDVGEEKKELTEEDLLYYDDENAHPLGFRTLFANGHCGDADIALLEALFANGQGGQGFHYRRGRLFEFLDKKLLRDLSCAFHGLFSLGQMALHQLYPPASPALRASHLGFAGMMRTGVPRGHTRNRISASPGRIRMQPRLADAPMDSGSSVG